MVLIITGATHVGKTNLAQKLMEKFHHPYLSEDLVKMGLIRSGNTNLTPEDDYKMVEYLWPIIKEIIKTAIENNQNLIVEGCYVPFDWKEDFNEEYLCKINFICLCFSDSYIDKYFKDIKRYASCIETRVDDNYYNVDILKNENNLYLEGCKKHNLEYVLIENNYTEVISDILVKYENILNYK